MRRQLREAYRMHKHQRLQILTDKQQQLAIAFIYLSDELTASAEIEEKMKSLLARISEKLV
ncbi:ribonuclease P [Bacteroides fragilis]|nr:ribonuclease P [Bacteroides fragilis]